MILRDRPGKRDDNRPCERCGAHEGRAFARGLSDGVRLLRDALERGDLAEAQRIIDIAERRAAGRGKARG